MKKITAILFALITLLSVTITVSAAEAPKATINTDTANDGYISITLDETITQRLRVRLINDKKTLVYNTNNVSGTNIPLTLGNGKYTIDLMQNTTGTKYRKIATATVNVTLVNDYAPYTQPNMTCQFTQTDSVAELAASLTAKSTTVAAKVNKIYSYVSSNVTYDYDKAKNVQPSYLPDPNETLDSKTGICYDYASLMTAMCRSQNIPCKIVVGWAQNNNYHAWVEVYIDGTWTRFDPTYRANWSEKKTKEFTANDSNYITDYTC